jgi:hypothetical protein
MNGVLRCAGMGHGTLPEGLVLNTATGAISSPGTVSGMGTYAPLFIVTDAQGTVLHVDQIIFPIAGNSTLGGCEFFPSDSIFHAKITGEPSRCKFQAVSESISCLCSMYSMSPV